MLFQHTEIAKTVLRPGVVVTAQKGSSRQRVMLTSPPTFGSSLGRTTVYFRGRRLTLRNTPHPHDVAGKPHTYLLSQITAVESYGEP